jgi:hypothetical protein
LVNQKEVISENWELGIGHWGELIGTLIFYQKTGFKTPSLPGRAWERVNAAMIKVVNETLHNSRDCTTISICNQL